MAYADLAFVFTDIERSTRLVRELGDAYADTLRDTRRLIGDAFADAGGRIVESRGDEVFAVFERPGAAVEGALAGQRALFRHDWRGASVRVRMGIHVGTAMVDKGDLLGVDVHRASRIASAAHGGQVVLSEPALAQTQAETRLLGEYELAGLPEPERIYQLIAADLPTEFPPLRAARRRDERPVRVVVADDSVLLREGIASVLVDAGLEVAAQAGSAGELLRCVAQHGPDAAVVDIRMPPRRTDDGLRAARAVRRRFPRVGVLLLSEVLDPVYALELVRAGESAEGAGYLLKNRVADIDEFAAAVRRIASGESAIDAEVVADLMRRRECRTMFAMEPGELEVLGLLAQGLSDRAIAHRLFLPLAEAERAVASVLEAIGLDRGCEPHRRTAQLLAGLADSYFAAVA